MKKQKSWFIIFVFGLGFAFLSLTQNNSNDFEPLFKEKLIIQTNSLLSTLKKLSDICNSKNFNVDSAKSQLALCRSAYKKIDPFVNYFFPGEAIQLNRAVVPAIEEDDEVSALVPYSGFQYLETLLYNDSVLLKRKELKKIINDTYFIIQNLPTSISLINFEERSVWEAAQLGFIRQFMLGITDFETVQSKSGREESASLLVGLKENIFSCYPSLTDDQIKYLSYTITETDRTINFLSSQSHSSDFNYFLFYSNYYNQLSQAIQESRDHLLGDKNSYETTAINLQIRSIFDPHSFNSYFFVPGKNIVDKNKVIELGRILFFDPALSANNLRACASCHQPEKAFTDGLALSQSFEPGKSLTRNAPTLVNSVLQRKLFHDGRAFTFEDQAGRVMSNPLEMHNDFSAVAEKLVRSYEYRHLFSKAFSFTEDTIISSRSILLAIAEYERTLIGMNSRFDQSISGRASKLSNDEIAGFNLFVGKAQCASCHFLPLFNGLLPPTFVETEWESIGVPNSSASYNRHLDNDLGRYGVIPVSIFRNSFKVPTLRNVAITAPYMHNGVFQTLDEVVDFYDRGGGIGMGYPVGNQTLSNEPLKLSPTEKFQLKSFLEALTDTTNITNTPIRLPTFEDNPELNRRPLGGDY